jgi:hypothetical protein
LGLIINIEGCVWQVYQAKSPEVGKWITNEIKVQHKQTKPTFDMLLSKYANQATGSIFNRSMRVKHPRSQTWMVPHPYTPYY